MKLSQAQSLLLQSVAPLVGGALVTTATAVYQALTNGHVDANTVGSFLLATLLATLGQALKAYVPAHIPQELQALKDTQQQLLDEFSNLTMSRPAIRPTQPQPIVLKQPTAPTAPIPAFVPPARPTPPATIQDAPLPDVPQQSLPVAPPEPPIPDAGG